MEPHLKLTVCHQSASDTGKIFFVSPLVNLPDVVVLHLASEAADTDLAADLDVLLRYRSGAIGIGRSRCLQKPASAVGAAFQHKSLRHCDFISTGKNSRR